MKKKLACNDGLTLVELLAAVIILILLGLMLNTGLQMALKSYHDLTAEAELQLLLSTISDALADDLRYAREIREEGGELIYRSDFYGEGGTGASLSLDGGQIFVNGKRLLPPGAYRNGAYAVQALTVSYDGSCFTADLTVGEAEGTLSAEAQFTVRCLNAGAN